VQIIGHKTESIYRRYAIVDSATLREAAAKIDMGTNPGTGQPFSPAAKTHTA
jgi:hypothetical protein